MSNPFSSSKPVPRGDYSVSRALTARFVAPSSTQTTRTAPPS